MKEVCHKGNEPEKAGQYLIKYVPELRKPFYIKALYSPSMKGTKWFTISGGSNYPMDNPDRIVAYVDWKDVSVLFEEE